MKVEKYIFFKLNVPYTGHIIDKNGIKLDPAEVQTIQEIGPPTTITGVRQFAGLCDFYRKSVKRFSDIVRLIFRLTRKKVPFEWTEECQHSFETQKKEKKRLMTAPVLAFPDLNKPFIIHSDASY